MNCRMTIVAAAIALSAAFPSAARTPCDSNDCVDLKTPDWVKDLVIYEIATKSFNSPGGPERGTFKSVKEKLPYLRELGINGIWMSGNNLADNHHFYNIWTQYACIRQDKIDPTLGTMDDLADLTAEAHKNGIRVFLDVISHGVMNDSPLIKEHPQWFKGGSWGMTDFDWYGGHKDLDDWWVKTFTDYVVKGGVDGYRIDVRIYRPDLWRRIKANARAAGKEIVIISESVAHCTQGVADVYQVWGNFCRNNARNTRSKGTQVCDVGRYYGEDLMHAALRWEARHKHAYEQRRCRFLVSFALSCHDNGWDTFASGGNPYQVRGSRAWMGYSSFFAPAIPIFFSGEEFNAKYVPIPHLAGSLYGDKRKGDGYWLYGSWLQWDQLKDKGRQEMLEDAQRMLALRREYKDLMHAWWTDERKGIVRVPLKTARPACDGVPFPVPYILHGGGKAVLVAANPTDADIELDLAIPFDRIGMHSAVDTVLTDVWNAAGRDIVPGADGSVRLPVRRDRVARGGIGLWEIHARKPLPGNLIAHTGESQEAPENSLEALRLAVERGFGFECDLQLSKDGRVFTFHDDDFTRLTGGAFTSACKDATWDEIKARAEIGRYGKWGKKKEFAHVRPVLLEDVLTLARDGRWIYLEVKYRGTEIVSRIKDVLSKQKNANENNVLFISFDRAVCKALKEQLPQYRTYWLTTEYQEGTRTPITVDYAVNVLKELGADGIDVRYLKRDLVTPALIKGIRDAGYSFHVWTIDRLDLAVEAFRKGVQTVTTNRPRKMLDEYRAGYPKAPVRTVYEAESAYLPESHARGNIISGTAACPDRSVHASGGLLVRYLGNRAGNDLVWRDVEIDADGEYILAFDYVSHGDRSFDVSVDGGRPITVKTSDTAWKTARTEIVLPLTAGVRTIRLSNASGWAPDIDRMTIARKTFECGSGRHVIRSTSAAADDIKGWERQSYPIGNGWFGVNVFGGVGCERLQVTENTMHTKGRRYGCNLSNALEIRMRFPDAGADASPVTGYARSLELETGLSRVSYTRDGVDYTREAFTSYPDRVMAVKFAASKKGSLSFDLSAEAPFLRPFAKGKAAGEGRAARVTANGSEIEVVQHLQYYGVKFYGLLKVVSDGKIAAKGNALEIRGATEATVYFSCGTNYRLCPESFVTGDKRLTYTPEVEKPDPAVAARVRAFVAKAAEKGYMSLKEAHIADFSGLMNRVVVNLPGSDRDVRAETTALLSALKKSKRSSAYLEETFFQYGRYLLVSSSRPGTLPANLQGVWTGHFISPWGSGYWHNINVQMNYWPAFITNLAECFEPYAAFNEAFRAVTRPFVAKYLARHKLGTMPSVEESPDIWCVGTPVYPYEVCGGPGGHSGPGTGGLTTKLFADWWDYTRDEKALRRYIWPVVHGMADFFCRCLKDVDGKYLSAFSASPEQIDYRKKSRPYYTTVGCAFDQQMIWENNNDLLRFAALLGTNDAVVAKVKTQIDKYDPVQIGASGQIKEFREENKYGEIGERRHRHISHLVGLYPGTLINANRPDWMHAAKVALDFRGDRSTGWALAHRMNCRARLGDGNRALKLLREMLAHRTYDNLWDAHPPYQIDGNFGATSAVAEMLLQSQAGYIDLLPALPDEWAREGSFKGLCARGRFVVDCAWKNGRPVSVTVRGPKGALPDVRFNGRKVLDFDFVAE